MSNHYLGDLLERVRKPARYLGKEVNAVFKNPGQVKVHLALAFPDLYEVGMSHLGLKFSMRWLTGCLMFMLKEFLLPVPIWKKY